MGKDKSDVKRDKLTGNFNDSTESLINENHELKKQLESIKAELDFSNKLMNASCELLVTLDDNGKIVSSNSIVEEMTGINHKDIIEKSIYDFIKETDVFNFALSKAKNIGSYIGFELTLKSENNREVLILANLYKLDCYKDKCNQFFLEGRDISKNTNYENELESLVKHRTEELNKTLALLQSSLESPLDMIIMAVDHNYNYLYFNQTHKNIMKLTYGVDVYIGMNIMECISSDIDREHARKNYEKALRGNAHTTVQVYGDRVKSYYESNYNPIYGNDKEVIGMCVFARDISERMNMIEKIKESEGRMNLFFDQSLTGFFIMMLDEPIVWNNKIDKEKTLDYIFDHQKIVKVNKAFMNQYGYTKESQVLGKTPNQDFANNLLEGRKAWRSMLDKKFAHIVTKEYKIDGSLVVIEGDYICMYDDQGRFIGHFGNQMDVTERFNRLERIEFLSSHDNLTGLLNRQAFLNILEKIDKKASLPLGLLMLDINGLKFLNDAYGVDFGDEQLKIISNLLQSVARKKDFVARVGGDEFVILVPNATDKLLYRYKDIIRKKIFTHTENKIKLSVTVGYEIKHELDQSRYEFIQLVENRVFAHKAVEASSSRNKAVKAILKTLNDKYQNEKRHSTRVSRLCADLGLALGLDNDQIKELEMAGLYHDIGKISIPDRILNKPEKLTDEEFTIMKTHSEIGYQIFKTADEYSELALYARHHHERWDGLGYPMGLKGKDIPYFARIICVVDAYEAMTSDRPYRKKMSKRYAVKEIIKHSALQFDPIVARVFVEKVLHADWKD